MSIFRLSVAIEQHKENYTKTERKLYDYIVENMETVMIDSITELAEKCAVGEATVLRFCRKIGYKGYQDFKLAIAMEKNVQPTINEGESHYITGIYADLQKSLEDTLHLMAHDHLKIALDWIRQYDEIVLIGVGHSGITALDFQSRLLRVGIKSEALTDSHFQVMRASLATEKTLFIALSISGSTKDIVDAVVNAKKYGAKVIAITGYSKSPLSKHADLVLLTNGKGGPLDGGSMVGKMSQLFMVEALCVGLEKGDLQYHQNIKKGAAEAVTNKII